MASNFFDIINKIGSASTFLELDDTILKRIEFCDPSNDDVKLRKAKSIVNRIRTRKLYRYVSMYVMGNNSCA